jgi:hypothetical protein
MTADSDSASEGSTPSETFLLANPHHEEMTFLHLEFFLLSQFLRFIFGFNCDSPVRKDNHLHLLAMPHQA